MGFFEVHCKVQLVSGGGTRTLSYLAWSQFVCTAIHTMGIVLEIPTRGVADNGSISSNLRGF